MVEVLLLIAKLATGIPTRAGALYKDELQTYLRTVANSPTQHLIDSTADLLIAYHTLLVLLQASMGRFDQKDDKNKKYMVVASFTPDWVEKNKEGGLIGGKLKESQTIIENLPTPYKDLRNSFGKDYPVRLATCFKQLQSLPDDFQIEDCLSNCLKSANVLLPECLTAALDLCDSILLSSNLEEAKEWLDGTPPNPLTETTQWLKSHVGIKDTFDQQVNAVTDMNLKRSLRRARTMLIQSGEIHQEIIDRLHWVVNDQVGNEIEKGNDIKEAINNITQSLSPGAKAPWENLQSALFGALSWHIVNQASYAAGQVSYVFKASGF